MNHDASTLISLLEKEIKSLRDLISEAIHEEDFNHAHAHQKALNRVLRKLFVVQNLEDTNYDRREFLESMDERYQKLAIRNKDFTGWPYAKSWQAELEHLRKLNPVPVAESNVLSSELKRLLNDEVRGLDVVLSKANNFVIRLRRRKTYLMISIPNVRALMHASLLLASQIKFLNVKGFELNHESRLEMKVSYNGEAHHRIMVLLSVIVFEVFDFRIFKKQSFIEVFK